MKLRDYQLDLMARTRAALKGDRRVICQAPTGAGKTALAVYMMGQAARRSIRSTFVVHRHELLQQTSRALWEQGLEHGLIAPNRRESKLPIQVASIQTLIRRVRRYPEPGLVVIDEAHRSAAATYRRLLDAWPEAHVVGLTATPERTDGRGLDDLYGDLVKGPSVRWLIDEGYLSDYRLFAPGQVDTTGLHTRQGDYVTAELEQAVDTSKVTGDAVAHYRSLAHGRQCVVFCVSRRHAQHVMDAYRDNGIRAESVDGKTPRGERNAVIQRFRERRTQVLVSIELLVEGLDIPGIEAVQILRPTQSVIVHLQSIGRALRRAEGKSEALILDHAGNCLRHGLPDEQRDWTLEGRKRTGKANQEPNEPIRQCPVCFGVHRPAASCPYCGHVYVSDGRLIEEAPGELVELDREAINRERKREQAKARSLEDLVQLGMQRGMRDPGGWAAHVAAARRGGKATVADKWRARSMASSVDMDALGGQS